MIVKLNNKIKNKKTIIKVKRKVHKYKIRHSFLKPLKIQQELYTKKKKKKKIIRKRVQRAIKKKLRVYHHKVVLKGYKPNIATNSYAKRFLIKVKRKLFYKTLGITETRNLNSEEEFTLYNKALPYMTKADKRAYRKRKLFKTNTSYQWLSRRRLKLGRINITHALRNTFVVISNISGNDFTQGSLVVAKFSCGSIGYRGPKKDTRYAREQTVKAAGNYISYNQYTAVDVTYNTHTSFWNKRGIRTLLTNTIFVRFFSILYKRSHGFIRKQKGRRV
jgi:ribosomal protein S11